MKREVKIPKGWRRGALARSPVVAPLAPPVKLELKEVAHAIQPETKTEEREPQKNRKGKKEKVEEISEVKEVAVETVLVLPENVEEGRNGSDEP